MAKVLLPTIEISPRRGGKRSAEGSRTKKDVEADLRRGVPLCEAPGPGAARPQRRPEWLKVKIRQGPNFTELRSIMQERGLHTV